MNITVAGTGPGSAKLHTREMTEAMREADIVLTSSKRIEEEMRKYSTSVKKLSITDTVDYIQEHAGEDLKVCIAASGDTGFYSVAGTVANNAPPGTEIEFLSGIGSMQYFAAKTKTGYEDMKLVSLHGRNGSLIPCVTYNRKVFSLTGGEIRAADAVGELIAAGLGHVMIYAGENLSLPGERIVAGEASEVIEKIESFGDLAVLIVINEEATDMHHVLDDEDFERGRVPMTKKSVRQLAAAELDIHPDDVVYDIGSGTGAMTCVMAKLANESFVYGIEKNRDGIELARKNMEKLGIYNIRLIEGEAMQVLEKNELPVPDKVFIGGSSGHLEGIVSKVMDMNKDATVLVTAVTLETLAETASIFESFDLDMKTVCINSASAHRLGAHSLMKAENPVYIMSGKRKQTGEHNK